jgi:hypothetical protein
MKTEAFRITLGIQPGYKQLQGEVPMNDRRLLQHAIDRHNLHIRDKWGNAVSCVVMLGNALYEMARGCPEDGEPVFVITGVRNPEIWKLGDTWHNFRAAVQHLAFALGQDFQQARVYLEFHDVDFFYLKVDAHPEATHDPLRSSEVPER